MYLYVIHVMYVLLLRYDQEYDKRTKAPIQVSNEFKIHKGTD